MEKTSDHRPAGLQFSISAILWLTATVGMVLAYLRAFEEKDGNDALPGLASVGLGLVVGLIAAAITRRWADAIYWSVIGATATFLCAAGYELYAPSFRFGWMLVGAVAGAGAGVTAPGKPIRSMLVGGLGGGAVLGAFAVAIPRFRVESLLEVGVAIIGGALLGGVVEAICWVESRRRIPRYITAAGLVFAVIAGNVSAKFLIPGW